MHSRHRFRTNGRRGGGIPRGGTRRSRRMRANGRFGKGAMIGLVALSSVFAGGVVLTSQASIPPQAEPIAGSDNLPAAFLSPISPADLPAAAEDGARAEAPLDLRGSIQFELCGNEQRLTCVVDGDTFWLYGTKIRIADIDTPEVSQPRCSGEKALGERATLRLIELLNAGPFELEAAGDRDEDRYGRKLRLVTRGGESLGDRLVIEGLARAWTGQREPWC